MLSVRLCRVQHELHSHRQWLRRFIANTETYNGFSLSQSHRPLAQQRSLVQRAAPSSKRSRDRASAQPPVSGFKWKHGKPHEPQEAQPTAPPTVLRLRAAVAEYRIKDVANLYGAVKDKSVLTKYDFRTIAQALHHCLRLEKRKAAFEKRSENIDELVELAEELVRDVKKGKLVPEGKAHVHLISFFKEAEVRDAGVQFWQWLEQQDDIYVNVDVYGAAIELLTVHGAPLAQMEDLYQQALNRFPGNFAAYHLSPEAMVPDRDQAFRVGGIPMVLLQGILSARLLRGDTRNAYLALDTAVRLYPDQTPPRFFTLFFQERPVLEAYTVFAIACRAGIVVPQNQYRHLLTAIRTRSELDSPERHSLALRAMLSSLYLYIGAGGQVTSNVVNEIVITITQVLRLPGAVNLGRRDKQKLADAVMPLIRTVLSVFARYGATPAMSAFNAIITNLGGYGGSKQIIDVALSDAKALRLKPTDVTRRSVLTAAGLLDNKELAVQAWSDLFKARMDAQQYPDASDFHILTKVCHRTDQIEFAQEQFEAFKEHVPSHSRDGIVSGIEDASFYQQADDGSTVLDITPVLDEIKKISADLKVIDERTRDRASLRDSRDTALPMTLVRLRSNDSMPGTEMRKLYEKLSTEQKSPQISQISDANQALRGTGQRQTLVNEPAVTPTNIRFDTLRYENWKSINYLLEQAEKSDKIYHESVDKAIAAGVLPPRRTLSLSLGGVGGVESYGLSDLSQSESVMGREASLSAEEVSKGRERILRLRGRAV